MGRQIEISGKKFSRLLVLGYSHSDKFKQRVHNCQCDCGNIIQVTAAKLVSGNTKSCGCLSRELIKTVNASHTMSKSVVYRTWCAMKSRCNNQNDKSYKFYGALGIKVCPEWENNFMAFYNHIGPKPSPKYTLDRIEGDKGYLPGNVRWATIQQQQLNKKNNVRLTLNGESLTLSEWTKKLGLSPTALQYRIKHWPIERILSSVKYRNNLAFAPVIKQIDGITIPEMKSLKSRKMATDVSAMIERLKAHIQTFL